jgi:hypothetical protein
MRIIEFSPPMSGLDGEFNTFRLGIAWSKRLMPGDLVCLMNKKEFLLMGHAEVTAVHVGKLSDMSALHARRNHNQLGLPPDGAGERLIANMIKRYGPHKCLYDSKVTVIYMNRRQL